MANVTLIRLVLRYPDLFYNQDWYYDEEFAHKPLPVGELGEASKSAAGIVYDWLTRQSDFILWDRLYFGYVWTTDYDDKGNRVYVGGFNRGRRKGMQIHRHLASPEVSAYEL